MHAIEFQKPNRGAPAVLAIAAQVGMIYLLVTGLGVVHTAQPRLESTATLIPSDKIDPLPEQTLPFDPQVSNLKYATIDPVTEPDIPVEQIKHSNEDLRPPHFDIVKQGAMSEPTWTNARILKNSEPPYPSISRLSGEEGVVLVRVNISPFGAVTETQLDKSSGYARLDEAALKAVRTWRFAPATRGSRAMASWVVVPVRFMLTGR